MRTELVLDPDDESKVVVARYADLDEMKAIADACKTLQNEGHHGDAEMPVYGHYPAAVIDNYCVSRGISLREFMNQPEHAKNIMRDPSLASFRVKTGAV